MIFYYTYKDFGNNSDNYKKIVEVIMNSTYIEYPALIYKSRKNHVFVANCIMKKLVGYGKTESEAVTNLEKILNKNIQEYFVRIKPVYNFIPLT